MDALERRPKLRQRGAPPRRAPPRRGGRGPGWLLVALIAAWMGGSAAPARAQADRSFHLVVLGDSVMWGEGLPEEAKFTAQVQQWLGAQLQPRRVLRQVLAHAGAVIRPVPEDTRAPVPGEIGSSFPSITAQVMMVPPPDRLNTELVLVNGGINDVGVLSGILNTSLQFGPEAVRALTRERVNGPMNELLRLLGKEFPRAQVLVTGYYLIVSRETPLPEVLKAAEQVDPTTAMLCRQSPLCELFLSSLRDKLTQQSTAWWEESTQILQGAAEQANRTLGTSRFHFVPVAFGPEHAYGTAATYLWRPGEDPLTPERTALCAKLGQTDIVCRLTATGHPNLIGAAVYREAILAQLQPLLPLWK